MSTSPSPAFEASPAMKATEAASPAKPSSPVDSKASTSAEEEAIRSHPLYPVLSLAVSAVEEATLELADPAPRDALILQKLKEFHASRSSSPSLPATETDRVVCLAIGVLRTQLGELAKVRLLCHEFVDRYISNLRSKMSQEQLLGFSNDSDDEESSPTQAASGSPDHSVRARLGQAPRGLGPVATLQTPSGPLTVQLRADGVPIMRPLMPMPRFPLPMFLPFNGAGLMGPRPPVSAAHNGQPLLSPTEDDRSGGSPGSPGEGGPEGNNNRKAALPGPAVDVLKAWLFKHAVHPYPSESEKRALGIETGLSQMQVNNWFINARRRILQPMAEESATAAAEEEAASPRKKTKPDASPPPPIALPIPKPVLTSAQRYWPFSKEPNSSGSGPATSSKSLDLLAEKLAKNNGQALHSPQPK